MEHIHNYSVTMYSFLEGDYVHGSRTMMDIYNCKYFFVRQLNINSEVY